MQNYETYEQMMSQFGKNDHIGSAMEENAKYIDSVAGKLAQLKATWTGIATTVFQSDTIKGFLEGFNTVSEVIGKVISKIDEMGLGLPTTIASIATAVKLFGSIRDAGSITGGITSFGTSIASFLSQASTVKSIGDYFSLIGKSSKKASSSVSTIAGEMVELAGETAVATTSGIGLGTALKGLTKIALPIAGVVAVGYAIKKATDAYEDYRTRSTRHLKEVNKNINEHKQAIEESSKTGNKLSTLYDKYTQLSSVTNKTKKQQEEYNKTLEELANIDPDLVIYDEDGSPIQARIGELKDYITEMEKAEKINKRLFNQDLKDGMKTSYGAYKEGIVDYQKALADLVAYRDKHLTNKNGQQKSGADLVSSVITGYEGADKNANEYFKSLEEFKRREQEFINQVVADRKEVSQYSSDWLENLFGNNKDLENAGKKRQQAIKSVLDLDFSQFDGKSMESLGNQLNNWLGSADYSKIGDFNKHIQAVNELNKAWQDGDITSKTYKDSVNQVAVALAKLTGMEVEEWAKMLKLPEFDVEDAYKTFDDLDEAKQTLQQKVNEMAQIESPEGRIELAYEVMQDERTPVAIKNAIEQMLDDGQITNQELEILLDLIGKIQEDELENTINEEIDKLSEAEKVTKEVAVEYALKVENGVDFDQYLQELIDKSEGGVQLAIDIQTDMDSGDLESLKNDLANLPKEKQIGILLASYQSGEYDLAQIHDFLEQVPPEVKSAVIASIEATGQLTPKELNQLINGTPPTTEKKVEVKTEGAEKVKGDLQEIRANAQDEHKQVQTTAPGSGGTISTLSRIIGLSKPENKPVNTTVPGSGGTISTLSRIIGLSNPETKTVTTINNGGSGTLSTLQSIASWVKNRSQTITTYFKSVGTRVASVVSSAGGGRWTKSTGDFTNVSETPSEVSAQGEVSAISDTPTESEATSTEGEATPTTSSGGYSAKAKAIDSVLTANTKESTIKITYDNVWKSIKYGINLFQELENRISRVQNNLKLLDAKMENAFGTKKIGYLQQQIKLLKEESKLQKKYYESLTTEQSKLATKVKKYGFTINSQGNLLNYDETLRKLEKKAEDAEKRAKKASDKASDYSGKNKKTKSSLDKASKNAQKEADSAKTRLEDAKKATDEYLDLMNDEIPKTAQAWQELQNEIKKVNDEIEQLKFEQKIYKEQHAMDELNSTYEQLSNYIERTRLRKESLQGQKYIDQTKKEISQMKELVQVNKDLQTQNSSMKKDYKKKLAEYGAIFDSNGQISNKENLLNSFYDTDDYEKLKDWVSEYEELVDTHRDLTNENVELQNELKELNNEVKKLELEEKIVSFTNKVGNATQDIVRLQNKIDLLDAKSQNAEGVDKLDIMQKQIICYEKMREEQEKILYNLQKTEREYKNVLSGYGFSMDKFGSITNLETQLKKLENHEDYEYIEEVTELWKQIYNEDIPNAEKSIVEYNNAVQDLYEEQLNITKEVEDKITQIYKKQIEERKKAIEDETNEIIKQLEKQKKAYQDMRAEAEYEDEYNEKSTEIADLQRKLEIARKDDSLGNRKKITELEKELAEAQKDLSELVQDKIDTDIEGMYDDQIESVEEQQKTLIEDLEEYWSDSKIAEMVAEVLKTGVFEGIDGAVTDLQNAMLTFGEETGEMFGVTGELIREEWVGNLEIALSTMKDIQDIMKGLNTSFGDYSTSNPNTSIPVVSMADTQSTTGNNNISTGDINVNVKTEGEVDANQLATIIGDAVATALGEAVEGL